MKAVEEELNSAINLSYRMSLVAGGESVRETKKECVSI